jgi:hypothetical protein
VTYPTTLDNLPLTSDGVTDADELLFNGIIDALNRTQQYGGTQGDAAASGLGATLTARVAALEEALVGTQYPTAIPSATHGPLSLRIGDTDPHTVLAAPGPGAALYVTQVALWNSSSVATTVAAREGSGGATRLDAALAASPGTGFIKAYDPPWELPENTPLVLQATVAISSLLVNVDFYAAPPR